jgi:hypothetical protein
MQGDLELNESASKQGATFTLSLPRAQVRMEA